LFQAEEKCTRPEAGNQPARIPEGHRAGVDAVALTGAGKRAVSASNDRTVRVWEVVSKRPLLVLQSHTYYVMAVAVPADGKRAVSVSKDKTLKVWGLEEHSGPALAGKPL
jgi:WD40 repeat protein